MPASVANGGAAGTAAESRCGDSHVNGGADDVADRASFAAVPVRAVRSRAVVVVVALLAMIAGACGSDHHPSSSSSTSSGPTKVSSGLTGRDAHGPQNVYAYDNSGGLSRVVRGDPALVYVPNSMSGTVDVISQRSFRVVAEFPTGALPQHVTPSYNLKTLYVDNDLGNSLTPVNPRTGRPGRSIPVEDPYNLYFTPDGRFAIVVAERLQKLDFRNPATMRLIHSLAVPMCYGVDHMDFSAHGWYAYASCEFNGKMIQIDLRTQRVVRTLVVNHGLASPQDVKLAPNGRLLYVADQQNGGLWEVSPFTFKVVGFLRTGGGAHGLYPSRDARVMYVSNRQAGTISVVSFRTRRVIKTWQLPLPASPDMGGVSVDGRTLWLSGRYNAVVYAINTANGKLRATIPVGDGPHGLCVWPQPGRYSLGHTGILR
jgi:DNA-binding beta-propeller fold protein YncE